MKYWVRLLFLMIVALLPLAMVSAQEATTLTIGINSDVQNLDPHHAPSAIIGNRIYGMIFDQLTRTDNEGNVTPMLATEWSSEGTTWVFKLRPDVKFQDGTTMTAEDAAYSLNRLLSDEYDSFIRPQFAPYITSVEATGDLELTITTPAVDPLLSLRLASAYAAIMPQAYVESAGFDAVQTAPIGAGPYKVVEWIPGDRIVLEANKDYWMGAPAVDNVVVRIIPEIATRVAALQSGEVDFITTVPPDQTEALEATDGVRVDTVPVYNFMLIYFNTNKAPTDNPLVRRALSLAIDREAIAESLWGGRVRVMNDYYLPGEMAYDETRPSFAYDPEEAARLLAEAGYNGETLEFTPPNAYYTNGQLVTDVIAEMWKAVGINVDYTPLDTAAWADRSLAGENIATLQSFGTSGDPATNSTIQTWAAWMGQYYTPSDEFNALAASGAASFDQAQRLSDYRAIADIIDADVPFAPLYQSVEFYAMRDGITWRPHQEFYIDLRPDVFSIGA